MPRFILSAFMFAIVCLTLSPALSQASGSEMGEAVYKKSCGMCHNNGVAGAPKTGDAAAWKERTAQGRETLVKKAIEGYKGPAGYMPARGGNKDLTDDEVAAAVDYMLHELE